MWYRPIPCKLSTVATGPGHSTTRTLVTASTKNFFPKVLSSGSIGIKTHGSSFIASKEPTSINQPSSFLCPKNRSYPLVVCDHRCFYWTCSVHDVVSKKLTGSISMTSSPKTDQTSMVTMDHHGSSSKLSNTWIKVSGVAMDHRPRTCQHWRLR